MEITNKWPLYDVYMNQTGYEYQINALQGKISSLPDGAEKEYYQAYLQFDKIALQIQEDPANAGLSPQEINAKVLAATQGLQQEIQFLKEQNPCQCTSWSLPTNGHYTMIFERYILG
jgi:hypothetical protein